MGFAVKRVRGSYEPILTCDVCGKEIVSLHASQAMGNLADKDGDVVPVTLCHDECRSNEPAGVALQNYFPTLMINKRWAGVSKDHGITRVKQSFKKVFIYE